MKSAKIAMALAVSRPKAPDDAADAKEQEQSQ
jgi:hypothetical protein